MENPDRSKPDKEVCPECKGERWLCYRCKRPASECRCVIGLHSDCTCSGTGTKGGE